MRELRLLLSFIIILFAGLGITGVLPYSITGPVMLIGIALVNLVLAHSCKQNGKMGVSMLLAFSSLFAVSVVIYSLFF